MPTLARLIFATRAALVVAIVLLGASSLSLAQLNNGGVVTAAISIPGESDSYVFSASAGESIELRAADLAEGAFTPRLTLYNPSGVEITTNAGTTVASIVRTLSATGTHTVVIEDASGGMDETGTYNLYFTLVPGANELGELTGDDFRSDTIDLGDLDSFTFNAGAGENVRIRVADTGGTSLSPRIRLYGPSGDEITTNFGSNVAYVSRTLLVGGTHTVVISDASGGFAGTGNYDLYFAHIPGADEGGSLSGDETRSDAIDLGDLDSYTFDASTGQTVQIRVADTGITTLSPQIKLYDPSGTEIGANSSSAVAALTKELDVNGTFTIVVADSSGGFDGTGSYELYFVIAPGADEGGTLANHDLRTDSIDLGDLDSYTFDAEAGHGVHIRAADIGTTALSPRITLYDPAGGSIQTATGSAVAALTAQLTMSGIHTVVVADASGGNDATGAYDLHFMRAPGANEGGELVEDQQVAGTITLGDLDSFTVAATAGEKLRITVIDTGAGPLAPAVTLFGPTGDEIGTASNQTTATLVAMTNITGTYTILVRDVSGGSDATGPYSLTLEYDVALLSYAALGDSYSSGEGVAPYLDASDTLLSGCHRSTRAYATKIRNPGDASAIASSADGRLDHIACSGAVTKNVRSDGEGQNGEPTQLDPVRNVDATRELITMTIGGNDAQFAKILAFCFAHDACHELKPFSPHSEFEIGELFPLLAAVVELRLVDLLGELREATPNAAVLILDYPLVVGGQECPANQVPFFDDLELSASEQEFMRDSNRLLNDVVQTATILTGTQYVSVEEHFEGHGACGVLDDWIAGLLPFNPKGSFHPTERGQAEYANVVNDYLQETSMGWPWGYFPSGLPRNPPPIVLATASPSVLGGPLPTFGDLEAALTAPPLGCEDVGAIVVADEDVTITAGGFAPLETAALSLELAQLGSFALGTAQADSEGRIDETLTIPASLASFIGAVGSIEASGVGVDGAGHLALRLVQIAGSISVDDDGDGIPDGCDNCPFNANADQSDIDFDGAGDTCDSCPSEAPDDADGDGLCAGVDPCPLDPANDVDGDGVCGFEDNCSVTANADQADADGDGVGDACESLACHAVNVRTWPEATGNIDVAPPECGLSGYFDGTMLTVEAFAPPGLTFTGWTGDVMSTSSSLAVTVNSPMSLIANFCDTLSDADGDLVADDCDNCPIQPDGSQSDGDADGLGDACDPCTDADQDGYGAFGGVACAMSGITDCNDGSADAFPGAQEINDGIDNQCPGDSGYGLVDEIVGGIVFANPSDPLEISWAVQPNATSYEVLVAESRDFATGCFARPPSVVPSDTADEGIAPGEVRYYLVHALTPYPGSLGAGSSGVERDGCP